MRENQKARAAQETQQDSWTDCVLEGCQEELVTWLLEPLQDQDQAESSKTSSEMAK